jgi:hypothetical protein
MSENAFDLVSTDEMIHELARRHDELVVIRNTQGKTGKHSSNRLFIKTEIYPRTRGRRYDVLDATEMLTSAQDCIVRGLFADNKEEGEDVT